MIRTPFFRPRWPRGHEALVALLVLLCLVCAQPSAFSASTNDSCVAGAAPTGVVLADFVGEVMGNRTRMIQIACILVAIGVFILTRSIK
ncbi:MAG TPA: hypothetical protein VE988_28905 [Gemmataceae bacterium]|nr:hypothetical protein [Gemmataceae bacterium]